MRSTGPRAKPTSGSRAWRKRWSANDSLIRKEYRAKGCCGWKCITRASRLVKRCTAWAGANTQTAKTWQREDARASGPCLNRSDGEPVSRVGDRVVFSPEIGRQPSCHVRKQPAGAPPGARPAVRPVSSRIAWVTGLLHHEQVGDRL